MSSTLEPGLGALAADALRNTGAYLSELNTPVLRLGVTGLSRAGKTVFIAALVRNLVFFKTVERVEALVVMLWI